MSKSNSKKPASSKPAQGEEKEKVIGDYLCFIRVKIKGEHVHLPALVFPSYNDMMKHSPLPKSLLDPATKHKLVEGFMKGIKAGSSAKEPFAFVLGRPGRGFLGAKFETGKLAFFEKFGEFSQQYGELPSFKAGIKEALALMKISSEAEAEAAKPVESDASATSLRSQRRSPAQRKRREKPQSANEAPSAKTPKPSEDAASTGSSQDESDAEPKRKSVSFAATPTKTDDKSEAESHASGGSLSESVVSAGTQRLPNFRSEVWPILQKLGFKSAGTTYCRPGINPKGEDSVEGRDYFANNQYMRRHLCAYGLKYDGYELDDEEEHVLKTWIRFAIAPSLLGKDEVPDVGPEIRGGEIHNYLMKLGFQYKNPDYFLPGEKPKFVGGIPINGFSSVVNDEKSLSTFLSRFGLPPGSREKLSEDEYLRLELFIAENPHFDVLARKEFNDSDPVVGKARQEKESGSSNTSSEGAASSSTPNDPLDNSSTQQPAPATTSDARSTCNESVATTGAPTVVSHSTSTLDPNATPGPDDASAQDDGSQNEFEPITQPGPDDQSTGSPSQSEASPSVFSSGESGALATAVASTGHDDKRSPVSSKLLDFDSPAQENAAESQQPTKSPMLSETKGQGLSPNPSEFFDSMMNIPTGGSPDSAAVAKELCGEDIQPEGESGEVSAASGAGNEVEKTGSPAEEPEENSRELPAVDNEEDKSLAGPADSEGKSTELSATTTGSDEKEDREASFDEADTAEGAESTEATTKDELNEDTFASLDAVDDEYEELKPPEPDSESEGDEPEEREEMATKQAASSWHDLVDIEDDEMWSSVLTKLRKAGIVIKNGKGLVSYYFVFPGGKSPYNGGQEGVDFIAEYEGMYDYLRQHFGWKGDGVVKFAPKSQENQEADGSRHSIDVSGGQAESLVGAASHPIPPEGRHEAAPTPLTPPEQKTVQKKLQSCLGVLDPSYDMERFSASRIDDGSSASTSQFEKNVSKITGFLQSVVRSNGANAGPNDTIKSLYVCGSPGVGKSSAVKLAISAVSEWAEEQGLSQSPNFALLNAAHFQNGSQALNSILEKIMDEMEIRLTQVTAGSVSRLFDRSRGRKGHLAIVIVDEIDLLLSERAGGEFTAGEKALELLFNWASLPHMSFAVVGVSNVVSSEKTKRLVQLGMGNKNVIFNPYQADELGRIVEDRIGRTIVHPKAIEWASKKVAAASGDARQVLGLVAKAIEKCLETLPADKAKQKTSDEPIVNMRHMMQANQENMTDVADKIDGLPQMAKVVLCVALTLREVSDQWKVMTLGTLQRHCVEAARGGMFGEEDLNQDVMLSLVTHLIDAGLLVSYSQEAHEPGDAAIRSGNPYHTPVQLGVQLHEVESAMDETLFNQSFYCKLRDRVKREDSQNRDWQD